MGNCQAAEAATVVLHHPEPNAKVERIYWSISANEVMNSNPGHYVALLLDSPAPSNGVAVKQLKLLRPDDTLHIGHVYRLIPFEDVLKEFAARKSVKLGKLLKESGVVGPEMKKKSNAGGSEQTKQVDHGLAGGISSSSGSRGVARPHGGSAQWKPALQSIAEFGN